ncbi:MAG: phosphoenolpyruvate synthase [Bacteroidales bacterium]|nr:phosphoenolpyruvate synthase [Bacteroidales bacterium]
MIRSAVLLFTIFLLWHPLVTAQKVDNFRLKEMIQRFKGDAKGPYKDIRWFCKDGTTVPGTERCPEPGIQRARYKDEVIALGKTHHIFLGQILSTTPFDDFWDTSFNHSRLKQYQIEKYLQLNDNGWILKRARFYRGAYQAEDEEAWGADFLQWLLSNDQVVRKNYFLVRNAVKDIPHMVSNSRAEKIRALSREISDSIPSFMNIRVKIHGQPDNSDIQRVIAYKQSHEQGLKQGLRMKLDLLLAEMTAFYAPPDLQSLKRFIKVLPKEAELYHSLAGSIDKLSELEPGTDRVTDMADMLWTIRVGLSNPAYKKSRLSLLDLSVALEEMIFTEISLWKPNRLESLLRKISVLSRAVAGCGYLEKWEWERISYQLHVPAGNSITTHHLTNYLESANRVVEWSTTMLRATYENEVSLFSGFEPLANGFQDDQTRSSLLLPLGQSAGELATFLTSVTGSSNSMMTLKNVGQVRGLNPGYALGELVVVANQGDEIEILPDKIYVFDRPPADLKPVAGIATVSEGNLVSHVQLLARNLGIPNAVISSGNLASLREFNGHEVFYAVSPQGNVMLKPETEMTETERQLVEKKHRSEEKINVPVDKIDLAQTSILHLNNVNAIHSGKLCGPKAANLGQLKLLFPDNVVDGLVIPFGIFREHMNLPMPAQDTSYWGFLNRTFRHASAMQRSGSSDHDVEAYMLSRLEELRSAIRNMQLIPGFVSDLRKEFTTVFHQPIGSIPVFLRSDTNMEDLKDFTGAGLNLTLFNVLTEEKILQGIKDVWASPYSERSYRWRQRYLLNPENVYPSILIIPSVNVDYSGVMITKGVGSGSNEDLTIAFSRGVGGAVEGQEAESYLLTSQGENTLLAPARESSYTFLPKTGGVEKRSTTFEHPILSNENITQLRETAGEIKQKLSSSGSGLNQEVFDIELGFMSNRLWLFQVRPFVENKKALSSTYLESMSREIPDYRIPLSEPIPNSHEN